MTCANLKEQPFSITHDIIVGSIFRQVKVLCNFLKIAKCTAALTKTNLPLMMVTEKQMSFFNNM